MSDSASRISGPNPVFEDSELVIGLVAPVGTNLGRFQDDLGRLLGDFEYQVNPVRVSKLFEAFQAPTSREVQGTEEYMRLNRGMHHGNVLRRNTGRGEFLALAVAQQIQELRRTEAGTSSNGGGELPLGVLKRRVHVVRSLKHPDEVRALRRIYGQGFFLVGIIASEAERRHHLQDKSHGLGCTEDEASRLLNRDEHEEDPEYFDDKGINYGQRTRDTFHLADVFLAVGDDQALKRFTHLIFGNPYETPGQDEHSMFMAFASGLRSGDLSRQVGAVIVSQGGDLIATGANDVPKAHGGLYWPRAGTYEDKRDHVLGEDSNAVRRDEIVRSILESLVPEGVDETRWIEEGRKKLKLSLVMDVTEYGRAVHAEMEALMSCARAGVSPRGGTLYSTTFPCHNCAKHIVAAGISRVVYVEPYPKSLVKRLYPDSIALADEASSYDDARVRFEPFQGVGPNRFFDLFSMNLSSGTTMKRKEGTRKIQWIPKRSNLRVPLLPNSYIDREQLAIHELLELTAQQENQDG